MFDIVITGGTVVDGTGKPGYAADVGIRGENIEAIGDLSQAAARRVVAAAGLTVSPGFIDTTTGDCTSNPSSVAYSAQAFLGAFGKGWLAPIWVNLGLPAVPLAFQSDAAHCTNPRQASE